MNPPAWRTWGAVALVAVAVGNAYSLSGSAHQDAKLTDADGAAGDRFGLSTAASGDTILVGAPIHVGAGQGAAYVFKRTGIAWAQEAKLTPADPSPSDEFGHSVALGGDTAVVGSPGHSGTLGAVYVFIRTGTTWTQQQRLVATGGAPGDTFGDSVSLSGDTLVVGATGVGTLVGAAYVFTRAGSVWTQQAKLTASDAANNDVFGTSVAVSGETAVVGAYGVGLNVGAAYVFKRSGITWTEEARLEAPIPTNGDSFGGSVGIAGDTVVVGATGTDDDRGEIHVFTRSGTIWTRQAKLVATDRTDNDNLGSVAIEGDTVIGGAYSRLQQGAAYTFKRTGTAWRQTWRATAEDPATNDFFGGGTPSLTGNIAVVGAFGKNAVQGAVYVFDITPGPEPVGYVLPVKVKAKVNAQKAEKSSLTASGTFDTGTGVPNFAGAATLDVGGFHFDIDAFVSKKGALSYVAGGIALTIKPGKTGSSRAAFKLKIVGDLAGKIDVNGPVLFCFVNPANALGGTGKLTAGVLGPHSVTSPSLSVLKAAATLKGGGSDALKLTLGFATDGIVPAAGEDMTIAFGGTYTSPVLSGFVGKGSTFVRKAKAPGITNVTVDFAKGTITIAGAGLDLGAFAEGGNGVVVTITRGDDTRTTGIRMVRAGTKLVY